ncbi:MAG: hypothetical protein KatS3mg102_1243 [Planctomycetota bacterium]|nr:MAG: hypothetical protein KatS3mg102_1243 [Planctomycetota bacterium]
MDLAAFEQGSGSIDTRLAAALARIALVGARALARQAQQHALSALQGQLLEQLVRRGPAQIGALAAQLGVRSPTVSDAVSALERKGLVRRQPAGADGRGVLVRPSARGRRLAARHAQWTEVFRRATAELAPRDKAGLLRLLLRIIAELVQRGLVRQARICPSCEYFRPYAHPGAPAAHHCALVDLPLGDEHLRADCPDHRPLGGQALRVRLQALAAAEHGEGKPSPRAPAQPGTEPAPGGSSRSVAGAGWVERAGRPQVRARRSTPRGGGSP